jgi:hypothetical protein
MSNSGQNISEAEKLAEFKISNEYELINIIKESAQGVIWY